MRNPYRLQCNTRPVTLHPPYPGILPLGYGVGVLLPPSPPSPVGSRPLLSLPVSCLQSRFSARLLSLPSPCLAALLSAPRSPRLCFCQMAEPQQGAAGCWETPELPPRLSLWGSFRPSLEHFSACPLPEISPDDSISPSHPFHSWPSLTSLLQLLPVTFPSPDPSPITLSQASVYSAPCSLPLSPLLPFASPLPHPAIYFQNRSHRPLLHNPQSLTPSVHTVIQALRRQPLSSRVPTRVLLHPSLLSASASCGSLRPPRTSARPFPSFLLPLMSP